MCNVCESLKSSINKIFDKGTSLYKYVINTNILYNFYVQTGKFIYLSLVVVYLFIFITYKAYFYSEVRYLLCMFVGGVPFYYCK